MPRTVDTPRNLLIAQVRPIVVACHDKAGNQGAGRVRIVLRLRDTGAVQTADVTVTGKLPREVGTCSASRIRKTRFRVRPDTPRFASFPIVLPVP